MGSDQDAAVARRLLRKSAVITGAARASAGRQFAAASHVGGLTHYQARFVKLIEQAAQATGT